MVRLYLCAGRRAASYARPHTRSRIPVGQLLLVSVQQDILNGPFSKHRENAKDEKTVVTTEDAKAESRIRYVVFKSLLPAGT